ncbi:MAG: BLUF domain-containing protein [Rhodoferax sp.]|nr:BLUF domain-containing protein [Rhodoferax sp.]
MPELQYIAYTSTASRAIVDADLRYLLADARHFNTGVDLTGILLFNGLAFFQYLEGTPKACAAVMARIRSSSLHHSIYELSCDAVDGRRFGDWRMGCTWVDDEARWLALHDPSLWTTRVDNPSPCEGLALLTGFWEASMGVP